MTTACDKWLVRWLKDDARIAGIISTRVYHMEVFQNVPSESRYPCVVYELSDDIPFNELGTTSRYYTTIYNVYVISKRSQDLRDIADAIKGFATEEFDDALLATEGAVPPDYDYVEAGYEGVTVDADTENNEFAIEQQELGYKITTLSVSITNSRCEED